MHIHKRRNRYGDWTGHLEYTWALPSHTIAQLAKRNINNNDTNITHNSNRGGMKTKNKDEEDEYERIERKLYAKNPLFNLKELLFRVYLSI